MSPKLALLRCQSEYRDKERETESESRDRERLSGALCILRMRTTEESKGSRLTSTTYRPLRNSSGTVGEERTRFQPGLGVGGGGGGQRRLQVAGVNKARLSVRSETTQ